MSSDANVERDDLDQLMADVADNPLAFAAYQDAQRRKELAHNGRRIRKQRGLAQRTVAEQMGTTQSGVSALESGKTDPQLSTLQRWARGLERRADFAFVDPHMPVIDEQIASMLWKVIERKSVKIILKALVTRQHESDMLTVRGLAKLAELPEVVVERTVTNLADDEWVAFEPDKAIAFNFDRVRVIGVHIRHGQINLAVTDLNTVKVYYRETIPAETSIPSKVVDSIHDMFVRAHSHVKASGKSLLGVGVTLAGIVEAQTGNVVFAPDLQDAWTTTVPLEAMLQEKLGVQVVVENDANALGTQEYLRNGESNIIVLLIASGVGSSMLVNGKVLYGVESAGGELGHVAVEKNDVRCRCGQLGCLETILSESALIRRINAALGTSFHALSDVQVDAQYEGGVVADIYKTGGHALGVILASIVAGSNPGEVLIFGSDELVDLNRSCAKSFFEGVKIGLSRQAFTKHDAVTLRRLDDTTQPNAAASAAVSVFLRRPWQWVKSLVTAEV
jgi:predicted NBD/HSP70 family sugar kinase/transcriptional regulator with XRE-family HTH domain